MTKGGASQPRILRAPAISSSPGASLCAFCVAGGDDHPFRNDPFQQLLRTDSARQRRHTGAHPGSIGSLGREHRAIGRELIAVVNTLFQLARALLDLLSALLDLRRPLVQRRYLLALRRRIIHSR